MTSTPLSPSPDFEQLLNWFEGQLPEPQAAEVADQVAHADEATRATVDWLRGFILFSGMTNLPQPPLQVRQSLLRAFEARKRGSHAPGLLQRLIATLVSDSGSQIAFAGVRGPATMADSQHRQWVFSSDVADVVIDAQAGPQGMLVVRGQLLPLTVDASVPPNALVQLLRDDDVEAQSVQVDQTGVFAFTAVPQAVYSIVIGVNELDILIPQLELRLIS